MKTLRFCIKNKRYPFFVLANVESWYIPSQFIQEAAKVEKIIALFLILSFQLGFRVDASQEIRVLGIGSPCVDQIFTVEEDYLKVIEIKKGGSAQVDYEKLKQVIAGCQGMPHVAPGGSCLNTIKGLAGLGEKCAIVGKVGEDSSGEYMLENLRKQHVQSLFVPTLTPTAQVVSLLTPDHQRTMLIFPGASLELTADDLRSEHFHGVTLVHLEGYLLRNGYMTEKVMKMAKDAGKLISFDLGCFQLVQENRDLILSLLRSYVDIVFANEDEIFALTGLDPKAGCVELQKICPIAVVLMGKEGCLVGSRDRLIAKATLSAEVVDTTGAGDLFASGFLYGILRGYDLETCAYLGNCLGSTIVGVKGAEIPESQWVELKKIIQDLELRFVADSSP